MSKTAKTYNPKHPPVRVVSSGPGTRQTLHLPRSVDKLRKSVTDPLQR